MSWQKSPFTSSMSAAARFSGSSACQESSCLAKGCIQAEVLPLPTAPKMAMPVYSPRSGMVSHSGLKISLGSTG